MTRKTIIKLILIIILAGIFAFIDIPGALGKIGIKNGPKLRKGLDLIGGTQIVYQADMSKIASKDQSSAVTSLKDNIDKRINALGVTEPVIQTTKINNQYGLIVELPGIKNVNDAISTIGTVAQLEFKTENPALAGGNVTGGTTLNSNNEWVDTQLTGAHLKNATANINTQSGNPEIDLTFDSTGAQLFDQITKANLQKPVGIFLDNQLIEAPTVQSEISDGNAVITGKFTIDQVKQTVLQLNAGALPVPIKIIEQKNVGATLGEDSVKKGLLAGAIGLLIVALFMILYYRLSGLLAVIALAIYALIVFGIFKLSSLTPWAITLTLPGLVAFVLSTGMAVDANILIFERTKEELRTGKALLTAIEAGFARAWLSIRDSNFSSVITCIILFWLGTSDVKGFALTLAIGIFVSMFTAIVISRTFLEAVAVGKIKEKVKWFV
jgi:preprotein translocase subunit SecD